MVFAVCVLKVNSPM